MAWLLIIPNNDPRSGVALQTFPAKAADNNNQLWRFTEDGFIKSKLNGLVIDIKAADRRPGALLQPFPAKAANNDNQRWTITEDGFI
jgi:hypothetical protein